MKILIDGDGCPVVDLSVKICLQEGFQCILLCDTSHVLNKEGAETITVSKGNDMVDFALVNRVEKGDIVITQDYGLAAMCLARQALPISQNGMLYTSDNIDSLLMARHEAKKFRMAGGRLKGHKKRTVEHDREFEKKFRELIARGKQEKPDTQTGDKE